MILKDFEPATLQQYVGLWAISHPFYIRDQVDADFMKAALARQTYLSMYYIMGVEGDLLTLRGSFEKAKPSSLVLIESPSCFLGDKVLIRRTSGKLEPAVIKGIEWHSKRENHFYHVEVAGKMISRWVFEEDILMKL